MLFDRIKLKHNGTIVTNDYLKGLEEKVRVLTWNFYSPCFCYQPFFLLLKLSLKS